MRNFHEQQTSQLKTIINRANERVSLFQIQNFVLFFQFSNQNQNFYYYLYNILESEHRLTHTKIRILHQHHQNTSL